MKALIHVNDRDKWPTAVANLKNLLNARTMTHIALLINGEAVELLTDSGNFDDTLKEFEVYVCNHSLSQRSIDPTRLDAFFTVVPFGVVKIVELQEANYCYIKP